MNWCLFVSIAIIASIILLSLLIFFCCHNNVINHYSQFLDETKLMNLIKNKSLVDKLNQLGQNYKNIKQDSRRVDGLWWCHKTLPKPRHTNSPSNGLCFSGGGVVAMTYVTGYLRGLLESKVLNDIKIRHITGVSGATWVLTPCAYINVFKDVLSLESILGTYKHPSDLTLNDMLKMEPLPFIGNCGTSDTLSNLITNTIINLAPTTEIPPAQILSDVIAKLILKPLKLYYGSGTVIQQEREEAIAVQPLLRESFTEYGNAFYLRPSFPFPHFLITAMNAPDAKLQYQASRFPLEMTPSRIGCLSEDIEYNNIPIGGQISNYCFGGYDTEGKLPILNNSENMSTTIPNKWFTNGIEKYIGYPSSIWSYWFLKNKYLSQFVPRVKLNLPNSFQDLINQPYIGDGGYYDSCGISALLARQVKHVYVFMFDGCLKPDKISPEKGVYPISLQQIFGWEIGTYKAWGPGFVEDDEKHSRFWTVVDNLSNKIWEPAIYTDIYITKTVAEAGITPYQVKITWIIPSKTIEYQSQLSSEIQNKINQLENYPQYITPPHVISLIKLSPLQLKAAMNLASYVAYNYIAPLIKMD